MVDCILFPKLRVIFYVFIFFLLEWEERKGVPPGTVGSAIRMGGEASIWKRFMRGELGEEEFLKAFNNECSIIVSHTFKTITSSEGIVKFTVFHKAGGVAR